MSSTFSAELELLPSECSGPDSDTPLSARSNRSSAPCSPNTGLTSHVIPTCGNYSPSPRMLSAADFPASPSAPLLEDEGSPSISGPKCFGSSGSLDQPTSSERTSRKRRSPTRLGTSTDLAIARTTAVYQRLMQGQTISEIVGGSLHTPTRKANFTAPSMQKWPSCRRYVLAFGGREITPEQFEFLMGLPIGWTELDRSETPSSRKSRKRSGEQS